VITRVPLWNAVVAAGPRNAPTSNKSKAPSWRQCTFDRYGTAVESLENCSPQSAGPPFQREMATRTQIRRSLVSECRSKPLCVKGLVVWVFGRARLGLATGLFGWA
jgi:hypothetical protein